MSNKDYIDKEVEEIITKDIFEKHFKHLQIEGDDYILNKMSIELFRLKIRLIKYFKGSVVLNDLHRFNVDVVLLKNENILSKIEIEDFENFLNILNDKSPTLRDEGYFYMVMKLSDWFDSEQKSIYEKIIMLEEKNIISETLKNF